MIVHVDQAKELNDDEIIGTWQDIIIMAEAHIIMYHRSTFPVLSIALCGVPKPRIKSSTSCL